MSVVETSYGRVRGANEEGVHVFRGVPFAKPPLGDLRWRAPVPPDAWAGTRDALAFGPCAVQSTIPGDRGELIGIATHEVDEDCLYLNVWTPNPDDARRPVMVWIHGGGNTLGAGSQPRVNGEHLARIGDVVVVTLNYRLGALGFLYAPELGATGNEALLDQVAALRWVRAEIGAFGGDPDNVTVFGQSAGGFDIVQLMAMPAAQGCFDRAVPMSGSLKRQVTLDSAYATSRALAQHFGGFERLREVSATSTTSRRRAKAASRPATRSTFRLSGARMRCHECNASAARARRWNACRVVSWRATWPSRATAIRRTKKSRTGRNTTWTRAGPCYSPKHRKLPRRRWTPCVNSGRPGRRFRTST